MQIEAQEVLERLLWSLGSGTLFELSKHFTLRFRFSFSRHLGVDLSVDWYRYEAIWHALVHEYRLHIAKSSDFERQKPSLPLLIISIGYRYKLRLCESVQTRSSIILRLDTIAVHP